MMTYQEMMAAYNEMLKDPRWQEKRLRIMERDKFTCQYCNSNTETLNIHHLYYDTKEDGSPIVPWEYPDSSLLTICQECHESEREMTKDYWRALRCGMGQTGAKADDIFHLYECILYFYNKMPDSPRCHVAEALFRLLMRPSYHDAKVALLKTLYTIQLQTNAEREGR